VSRRRQPVTVEDDGPGAERWLVVAICLLLLAVILGGVGYLVWQAHSDWGGRSGTTTPPRLRPQPPRDKLEWEPKDKLDWDDKDPKREKQ
jgi:hypothetical protein